MIRLLFLLHRYLGIAVGFVLLLWCVSGFVMMYMPYPEMTQDETYQYLPPLSLDTCCTLPTDTGLERSQFDSVTIEMLTDDTPVLRLRERGLPLRSFELSTGAEVPGISPDIALAIAKGIDRRLFESVGVVGFERVSVDQWTVSGEYSSHRPMYLFQAADDRNTQWYVSSRTGDIVLTTTGKERAWNYFGAVVHWLYPVILRQSPVLWAQTVIWLSIAGVFLTATGLYIGCRQFKRKRRSPQSPYRGVALWHHYSGLLSGILLLFWVGSGALSMNPWGLLEGESARTELDALSGKPLQWTDIQSLLIALPEFHLPESIARIELVNQAGRSFVLTTTSSGQGQRYDGVSLELVPLTQDSLHALAVQMLAEIPVRKADMLENEDAYYYAHHSAPTFPVFRVIADDVEQRRYYLSPVTGQLLAKVDGGAKVYRWLFAGFHRGDFVTVIRNRPLWDVLMWLGLLSVTLLSGTGTVMAWKRLRGQTSR